MDPVTNTPAVAPQTFVQQAQAAQVITIPDMPGMPVRDSVTPAAAAPAATASPEPSSTPATSSSPSVPSLEPDSAAKLAEAEKRLRDTQSRMHEATTEAAKLRNQLNAIFNDPRLSSAPSGSVAEGVAPAKTTQEQVQELEMKRAFLEYQAAPSDEAAFAKLIALAEERASRKSVGQVEDLLRKREAEQVVRQRNMTAAETINKAVSDAAPDVPLELFWAMSARAELETPQDLSDTGQRLEWQVQRAVELSRAAITGRIDQIRKNQEGQRAVTQQVAAVMPAGGSAPVAGVSSPATYPTMAELIKSRQAAMLRH